MAVKLNLLPQDYAVSDSVAAVLKVVRPLNIILLGVFLVSALGMAGYFIFSSVTIRNLNSDNNVLKSQIRSQQTAQQQIVLLKDRLGKIRKVYARPAAYSNLSAVNSVLANFTDTATVSELVVDSKKTSLSVNFRSNSALKAFLASLNTETNFSSITMDSFSYTPQGGYQVGLSFVENKQSTPEVQAI